MRAFWNDCGDEVTSDEAKEVYLREASLIWSDAIRGVRGNYFGLIDQEGRTVQFRFEDDIPDHVEDASRLRIVLMDFPRPERGGSYGRRVAVGEVHGLIERAFDEGADPGRFGDLTFTAW